MAEVQQQISSNSICKWSISLCSVAFKYFLWILIKLYILFYKPFHLEFSRIVRKGNLHSLSLVKHFSSLSECLSVEVGGKKSWNAKSLERWTALKWHFKHLTLRAKLISAGQWFGFRWSTFKLGSNNRESHSLWC